MRINNTSFTGTMLIEGKHNDLEKIGVSILKNAVEFDEDGYMRDPIQRRFEYDSLIYDDDNKTGLYKGAFITKEDTESLEEYYYQKRIFDPLNQDKYFFKNHHKRFLKLPDKIYTAEEILAAIKNGLFDFANLVIKNK